MGQILPLRQLSDVGVVTDQTASSLPPTAFTRAKNVRFDEGAVVGGPVFRRVSDLSNNIRHVFGIDEASGYNKVLLVSDTFVLQEYFNGTITNVSGSISPLSASSAAYTGTSLADVIYVNREDRVPVYRTASGTNFADLPNWNSTWRAGSLRAYGDFLIALNMTEGTSEFPSRVRFSNLVLSGQVPDSWDATDTTKSAGFIDLVEMKTPIIDGLPLGKNFCIYSSDQVYLMEFVGGTFIMNTRKLFSDAGVINTNCVVEVETQHYVFSENDIYVHNGAERQSIVDGRVRNYIFNGMDTGAYDKFFVQHNPDLNEVYFCYKSGDDMAQFTDGDRCNRAAVYNYRNNTWSFFDMPNVASGTIANVQSTLTFATAPASLTFETAGGSFQSQSSGFDYHTLFVGDAVTGISNNGLYGLDNADTGTLSFPTDTNATKPPFIERVGIDLDEMSQLSGYKVIQKLYPQIETPNPNKTFNFTLGGANLLSDVTNYEPQVTFDSSADHKIDSRASGRYLSYKLEVPTSKDFSFTGFDLEVTVTGRR